MSSLEAVAGIVAILLVFSLLASIAVELISGLVAWRGKQLELVIQGLLSSEDRREELIKDFKNSSIYKQLSGKVYRKSSAPSYLSAEMFKSILFQVIASRKEGASFIEKIQFLPDEGLKSTLLWFWQEANQDFEAFSARVELWYEQSMERTAGCYKRKVQRWLLLVGLAIAIVFNVDILKIYSNLTHFTEVDPTRLQFLGLGWSNEDYSRDIGFWTFKVFGWLLTAICLAKGAPFCFDLLNKIVNFRDTGARTLPKRRQKKQGIPSAPLTSSVLGIPSIKVEESEKQPVG